MTNHSGQRLLRQAMERQFNLSGQATLRSNTGKRERQPLARLDLTNEHRQSGRQA